jgi:hypothetical protein
MKIRLRSFAGEQDAQAGKARPQRLKTAIASLDRCDFPLMTRDCAAKAM